MSALRWSLCGLVCFMTSSLAAQSPPVSEVSVEPSPRVVRGLIICGHPGDDEHRTLFAEAIPRLRQGLIDQIGATPETITVLYGVDPDAESGLDFPVRSPATREALTATVEELREQLQPEDTLWVIVVGHAFLDGRLSWFNIPGPDLHHNDFVKLFQNLPSREQVFWITTPASGYCLKGLSGSGRVVVTATEADIEVNATLCPLALAEELNPTIDRPLVDCDHDGLWTVFDLIIATHRNTARRYLTESLLVTEHGLLDDNGDGRGTEVQRDYLTEEEGGRPPRRGYKFVPHQKPGQDGTFANTIPLLDSPVSALSVVR
jgi:hypothetical protein